MGDFRPKNNGSLCKNLFASRRGCCAAGNGRVQKAQNYIRVERNLEESRNQRARGRRRGKEGKLASAHEFQSRRRTNETRADARPDGRTESGQGSDGVCDYSPEPRQKDRR